LRGRLRFAEAGSGARVRLRGGPLLRGFLLRRCRALLGRSIGPGAVAVATLFPWRRSGLSLAALLVRRIPFSETGFGGRLRLWGGTPLLRRLFRHRRSALLTPLLWRRTILT